MLSREYVCTYWFGGSMRSQVMRWMLVTEETINAACTPLNSVTMTLVFSSVAISLPSHAARFNMGSTLPRRLNVPSTEGSHLLGTLVILGSRMISSTLATLMP